MSKHERWIQVSAGTGPVECAWAVVKVIDEICKEAKEAGLDVVVIEIEPGPQKGTAQSAVLVISGASDFAPFLSNWRGTVQWIAQSPFRPKHKRKNWFVGIEILAPVEETRFDSRDVKWETMRAGGPGGQHVNKTESAVRATHLPTGISASASEERSQYRNRKLALARLAQKLIGVDEANRNEAQHQRWRTHQELERGNPVRVFGKG